MKFACPNCDSKYTISDERVRNKVLKIRCKSCSGIIEVRERKPKKKKAVPGEAPLGASGKTPSALENQFADSFRKQKVGKPKPKGTPGLYTSVKRSAEVLHKEETDFVHWFVAINNEPFGPVSARKIHSHQQAGKVTDASLVWKEGMADWGPIRNCKELVGLLAKIDLEQSLDASSDVSEKEKKLGLFTEQEKSDKSPLKGQELGVIAKREDEKLDGEAPPAAIDRGAKAVAGTGKLEEATEDQFFDKGVESNETALASTSLPEQRISNLTPLRPRGRAQNRWVMIAAVGFLIASMATLGVAVLGGSDSENAPTSVETVEKIVERVVYLDRPVERIDDDVKGAEVASRTRTGNRSRHQGNREKKTARTDAKTKALMEQMGLSTPGGAVPVGGTQKKQTSNSSGSGTGTLTANQVKKVVDRNKNRLKACYERALKYGDAPDDTSIRVDFKLKVGSSGIVKNTSLGGAGSQIPSLKQCLSRSVSKWVFPPSSATSPVEFPFVFTPK